MYFIFKLNVEYPGYRFFGKFGFCVHILHNLAFRFSHRIIIFYFVLLFGGYVLNISRDSNDLNEL